MGGSPTQQQVQQAFQSAFAANQLTVASSSVGALGGSFSTGNQAGVGRISVGGQGLLYNGDVFALAFSTEFFCNSPSSAEFAGSNSPAILPRIIGQAKLAKYLHVHTDVGYDYDFDVAELRRFVWNTGVSVPLTNWTIDLGVGGSKFDTPVTWTPLRTAGLGPVAPGFPNGTPGSVSVLDSSQAELSTNYVNFLFGIKVRLAPIMTEQAAKLLETTVLSGSVSVPVTSGGFQPAAAGTLALEYYF